MLIAVNSIGSNLQKRQFIIYFNRIQLRNFENSFKAMEQLELLMVEMPSNFEEALIMASNLKRDCIMELDHQMDLIEQQKDPVALQEINLHHQLLSYLSIKRPFVVESSFQVLEAFKTVRLLTSLIYFIFRLLLKLLNSFKEFIMDLFELRNLYYLYMILNLSPLERSVMAIFDFKKLHSVLTLVEMLLA